MLTPNQRLQPREQDVVAKVMDGEAIIINLQNGIYYSMDKAGGFVWEMIERKHTVEETITAITARYSVSRAQAEKDVEQLLEQLLQENLITPSEGAQVDGEPQQDPQNALAYEVPKLNIYRDMGDLLALDPPTPGLGETPWKSPEEESA